MHLEIPQIPITLKHTMYVAGKGNIDKTAHINLPCIPLGGMAIHLAPKEMTALHLKTEVVVVTKRIELSEREIAVYVRERGEAFLD